MGKCTLETFLCSEIVWTYKTYRITNASHGNTARGQLVGHYSDIFQVSNSGPYLILYSGHDHTLEQLSTALGIQIDSLLVRYAARIIFEVYHDNREPQSGARDAYFRVLANGRDITKQVDFCRSIVTVNKNSFLCKMEDIVRFIHDDYFTNLNYTNFKDACSLKSV